jgi:hypothetical protein
VPYIRKLLNSGVGDDAAEKKMPQLTKCDHGALVEIFKKIGQKELTMRADMAAPGPSPTTAACPAPRWSDTSYPLVTLVRVVLRLPGEVQARTDQQDTIEILLLNLAASDADSTLNILNIVKVFVFGVREKIMLKNEAAKTEEAEAKGWLPG